MPKTITEQNLRRLIDTLVTEGLRVIGPKMAGAMALYEPLAAGEELVLDQLPRRSGKEVFFPVCENILSYERTDNGVTVTDVDVCTFPPTVLIGARPCDTAAAPVLDSVFSWDYHDEFFLERRRKTTVIGLACTTADDACFCTAVGLSPAETAGSDLFLTPIQGGGYACQTVTEKGEELLARHPQLFGDAGSVTPLPLAQPTADRLDLAKIKAWLDENFESPFWAGIAERCVGCGACAFLCPACHCFDIVDEGGEKSGHRRKSWDACAFGKFTNHASGHNPRDVQANRYRNRVMHKFKYYQDKFGQTLCTGCGRCVRACPVGIDIYAVIEDISKK
ncbi:MAG TPA: 4Fe-4S dicluster domain-containing protein [Desulfuromonadaceae bacterium]